MTEITKEDGGTITPADISRRVEEEVRSLSEKCFQSFLFCEDDHARIECLRHFLLRAYDLGVSRPDSF